MKDSLFALEKAKYLLFDKGKIIFSVPGQEYLSEVFENDSQIGRFNISEIDFLLERAELFPLTAARNRFLMSFNSYEMFLKYLKSIRTYQKIVGYKNEDWNYEFDLEISRKFDQFSLISGEYLTYNCEDKAKLLRRR